MVALEGVHRVRMKLAGGYAEYWYAWRGGPRILREVAATEAALVHLVRRAAPAANAAYVRLTSNEGNAAGYLAGLIAAWIKSPEFAKKGERTRKDMKTWLAVVEKRWGDLEIKALGAGKMKDRFLEWRGEFAHKPRTADHYMEALAQLLAWAKERGKIEVNPLTRWERLYASDRSHIIWLTPEIEAICSHAEPELQRAILLAAYTGLRQGDLLRLTWADVGQHVITRRTIKRRRTVHIPIPDELQAVLELCPRDCLYVASREGRAWKVSTLEKRFRIARDAAGITGKRWHDFRGTYATMLFKSGLDTGAVARIMGWARETADEVEALYVSGEAVALTALERLKRFTAQTSSSTISKTETVGVLPESAVKTKLKAV